MSFRKKTLNHTKYVKPFWSGEKVSVDDLVRVEVGADGHTTVCFPKCDEKTLQTGQSVEVNFGPKYKRTFPHVFATVFGLERGQSFAMTVGEFLKKDLVVLDQHSNGQPETDPIMKGINEVMDCIFCSEIVWPWSIHLSAGTIDSMDEGREWDVVVAWPECLLGHSSGDGFKRGEFFIGDSIDPNAVFHISHIPDLMRKKG